MSGDARWGAATALAAAPVVVVGVSWLAWRDRLPDPMASHWSGSLDGPPDGFSSPTASVWWIGVGCAVVLAVVAVLAAFARSGRLEEQAAAVTVALVTSLGGVLAGAWLAVAMTALAAPDPSHAHLGARVLWIAALLWGLAPVAVLKAPRKRASR